MPNLPPMPGADWRSYGDESFNRARVLVVAFISNHCQHTLRIEDRLKELAQEFARQGALVAAINSSDENEHPDDSYEQMVLRAREHEFPFAYLRDQTQEVARAFGATHTPEFFVFDSDRRLRYHGTFDDSTDDAGSVEQHYLADAVSRLLDGLEVEVPETELSGCVIEWRDA